ncbi:hypothetical protein Taro_015038 [Colocasia esculenta]|uniref:Uncharacterized protein n=1 Tax=Colocasia esculenta TaxID=4460 RepID=A0A843UL03_COLES|nr:hypothetical protein [Colocasia esculenta]
MVTLGYKYLCPWHSNLSHASQELRAFWKKARRAGKRHLHPEEQRSAAKGRRGIFIQRLLYLLSLDTLPLNVRPRMTHTLTRKGMTKSEARSTLESLCHLRVVGQTFHAKEVSTHLLLVSTQYFKAKAEC